MTVLAPSPRGSRRRTTALVERLAAVLDAGTTRRGFLTRTAVVGSAVAVAPVDFLLKPGTAYAAVCGSDSTCSSGYTVFCATINGGVNRCPPGALVGGWWKADNSGFCCGSARYYIDCHSYCSCGCSGSNRFCGEGCRACSCGCGPADSCDQRRVCCNEFRYGQCMQNVSCTGPVWCRVVTCTPPWTVAAWACTTTSATDARTGSHTATGLPNCAAIDQAYKGLGGPGGFLGEAVTGERAAPGGGAYTDYDRGSIYWTVATGAHELHGTIRDVWRQLGATTSPLGYPTSNELPTADGGGRFNDFLGSGGVGSVVWRQDLGAHAVWGQVRVRWAALGGTAGPLGYPVTSELAAPDGVGRYNDFLGPGGPGSVYWRPDLGAHAVWGQVRVRWAALGGVTGPLGYPTTSETVTPDQVGRFNDFLGPGGPGSVYWHPDLGAHAVWGQVRVRWAALGGITGPLGYPTSQEVASRDGQGVFATFAGPVGVSSVHWSPATGAQAVWGLIRERWLALGGEDGPLGRPVSTEADTPGGRGRYNDFVGPGTAGAPGATICWSRATGAHSVRGRLRTAWLGAGGTTGRLGFPTAEPRDVGGGRTRSDFEGGYAVLDAATDAVTITYT